MHYKTAAWSRLANLPKGYVFKTAQARTANTLSDVPRRHARQTKLPRAFPRLHAHRISNRRGPFIIHQSLDLATHAAIRAAPPLPLRGGREPQ